MAKKRIKGQMAKKNTAKNWIIAILLIAIIGFGSVWGFNALSVTGDGTTTDEENKPTGCSSETTPDLLINSFDFENKGTAINEIFIYRKLGTTTWNTGTTGTELTGLEPGEEYEIVLGINTTDFVDNAYGEKFTYTVKCQEDDTIEKSMYNDEIETSLSATFFNKNSDASAQTFLAGEELVVSVKLKAGSDEYFGNPTIEGNNGIIVLKLNKTEWDAPNKVYLADGSELAKVSVPQRYDQQATGFTEYAYQLPTVSDKEIEIFLDLDADDTNAPSVDGTAYIYASGYYVGSDGNVAVGVEDEEGNAVATDSPDSVTLDFTV